MAPRFSPQELDPLGGVTAQVIGWLFTIGAAGVAVGLTVVHREEYTQPVLLAAAFVALAGALATVFVASKPRRAPFTRGSALIMYGFGLLAVLLEAFAQWGTNVSARSDWAPVALALLVLLTGCFRPATEILVCSAISVGVVVVVATTGSVASQSPFPPFVAAGLTAGPVLATGVGSAVFSATLVRRLLRWREATGGRRRDAAEQLRARARQDLRDERVELVESEVGPFLRGLLAQGEVSSADAVRAAELGSALRGALVTQADGVWLEGLVAELHDPAGLAARMDDTQRAAVEAACSALGDRHAAATLAREGDGIRLTLRWAATGSGRLGPELQAVLRTVFPGARLRPASRVVELDF